VGVVGLMSFGISLETGYGVRRDSVLGISFRAVLGRGVPNLFGAVWWALWAR
jgi:hypothetical protein